MILKEPLRQNVKLVVKTDDGLSGEMFPQADQNELCLMEPIHSVSGAGFHFCTNVKIIVMVLVPTGSVM